MIEENRHYSFSKPGVGNLFDFVGRIKYPSMAAGQTNKTIQFYGHNILVCVRRRTSL